MLTECSILATSPTSGGSTKTYSFERLPNDPLTLTVSTQIILKGLTLLHLNNWYTLQIYIQTRTKDKRTIMRTEHKSLCPYNNAGGGQCSGVLQHPYKQPIARLSGYYTPPSLAKRPFLVHCRNMVELVFSGTILAVIH